jgi:hypothetical protein
MNHHLRNMLLGVLLAGAAGQACAGDISTDAVLGGALGGGAGAAVGSAIGGRNGAMLGGALGAATGVAIATPRERSRDVRVVNYYEDDDDHWHGHHDNGRHLGHYKHHDRD